MKYIASWSGGKDSTASIILAHEHNEPLDLIIFVEVMFDENISGELPEHIDFVHKAIKVFEDWGYKVKILRSDENYMYWFHKKRTRSKVEERNGKSYGFPMSGKCVINSRCKMKPIREFWKSIDEDYTQYVGIAIDEPIRLNKLAKTDNKISLLEKYNYTEQNAKELCEKYGLLSPAYKIFIRQGCWFCPNKREDEMRLLRKKHYNLWQKLLNLEKENNTSAKIWNQFKNISIHDLERKFALEDRQISIEDLGV